MAAITAELSPVAKNLLVETAKGKGYKAVSERDIIDAIKPIESKYGIYSYPCSREILESHILESESEFNGKTSKRTTFFTRIMTIYRFVNTEEPCEYIETTTFSEGIDTQDKGSGKAMTYGDKYALMKQYKISTGDDPDQTASEETHYMDKVAQPAKALISEKDAENIIKGLDFIVGNKTEDQRKLLMQVSGYADVFKIPADKAANILNALRERAREIDANRCG